MITPEKILIIRMSSIGDIILASPLLRVLHARFPASHIDFLVGKEYAGLVRTNTHLNRIYEFDRASGFSGLRTLKHHLRAEHYNLVIDIHNSLRSRYLRWMLGANDVAVIRKRIIARTILIRFKKNFYRSVISVADRYIEPVRKYGIENDGKGLELSISDEVRAHAAGKMKQLGFHQPGMMIGLCPAAKHETKCWPQERFMELGVRLSKEFQATVLLFGGPQDKEKCSFIARGIHAAGQKESVFDLSGELSLLESAAVMESCSLVVTNDTGLMHIASAMKKKVIAMYGPTVREFGFFPVGNEHVVHERLGLYCRPCSHLGGKACPEGHFRCMKEIEVEQIIKSIPDFPL